MPFQLLVTGISAAFLCRVIQRLLAFMLSRIWSLMTAGRIVIPALYILVTLRIIMLLRLDNLMVALSIMISRSQNLIGVLVVMLPCIGRFVSIMTMMFCWTTGTIRIMISLSP